MALLVGGEPEAAERAYGWLFSTQRPDGSWPIRVSGGVVEDAAADANMCGYVAVGVWHHWLVRRDEGFLVRAWPSVRRALDFVTGLQRPFGGVGWALNRYGIVDEEALVAASSSIHQALGCGVALSEVVGEPQPEWELAAGRLGHAISVHEDRFAERGRYSMDWYYPVLGGALRGEEGRRRLAARWEEFVVPGLGIRCVDDRPWVTGAETCELALALDTVGERDVALGLLSDMQHLRDAEGAYWTGYVFADDARWPEERSTWTAAAVVLAADALSGTTPGSDLFRGEGRRLRFAPLGLRCGCPVTDPSPDGVAGLPPHADQHTH
jgi:hypothetical protein